MTRQNCSRVLAGIGLVLTALAVLGMPAGASELPDESETGQLVKECTANDLVAVYGQIWDDEDGDDRLLEDVGIAGVSVNLALEGLDATETDADGFWAYCIDNFELLQLDTFLAVEIPQSWVLVAPGAGDEDEDSDVRTDGGLEARTESFTIDQELTGQMPGSDELVPPQFEVIGRLALRIDVGLAAAGELNPCPEWNPELIELDPDGDWDEDGAPNSLDSLPCERGIANPCPDVSPIDLEVDPDGDWDGDGFANLIDDDACGAEEQAPNPCESNPAEAQQLAALSQADDWDNDGLVNGVDPTPCDAGVGNPCPDFFPIHLEEDPGGDWDGDGFANAEDTLPCNDEPFNPCPEWNDEIRLQFGEADWDEDGIPNRDDPLPCDSIDDDPCPNLNDLWIEQDPGGDWDGDGIVNAEDDEPCIENRDVDEEIDEPDDVSDADTDEEDDAEEAEGDDTDETPCPPNIEPGAAVDLDLDSDSDGVPDVDDSAPCDPAVPGDGGDGGGGFPWSPWGPGVVICTFGVIGGGIALTGKKGSTSGSEDRDKKPKRPTATIKDVDVS